MFKFNGETWELYKKKVTYTKTVTEYDDVTDRFPADAVITDNTLTDEQMIRLEAVKHISTIGLDDLKKYVLEGVIGFGAPTELAEADKGERTKKALLSSINLETVNPQVMVDAGLARKWNPNGMRLVTGEPVEDDGKLYKVKQSHESQADRKPGTSYTLFDRVSAAGSVEAWVQGSYAKGAKVTHKSKTWESVVPTNTWEPGAPGVYANIWKEVTA